MIHLAGVIVAVALVFTLLLLRKNLALVMAAGSLVLAFFMRLNPGEGFVIVWGALCSPATFNILVAIMGIGILGDLMHFNGALEKAISALKALVRDSRILVVLLPALVGLLPIPGGAYFSAPMVEQAGEGLEMSPARKALANICFRHFILLIHPFSQGFIAMILLGDIPAVSLAALGLLPAAGAFLLGIWFIFRKTSMSVEGAGLPCSREDVKTFLYGLLPILLAAFLFVALGWPAWAALLPALVFALIQYLPGNKWPAVLKNRLFQMLKGIPVTILLGVAGIMIFKEFIARTGVMGQLSDVFTNAGVSLALLMLLIPCLAGVLTGNCYAALALALPVLIPLLGTAGNPNAMLALAYQGAFWGYIVSPVHLCLLLTVEYFKVSLAAVIPHLAWMGAVVLAFSTVYFSLF